MRPLAKQSADGADGALPIGMAENLRAEKRGSRKTERQENGCALLYAPPSICIAPSVWLLPPDCRYFC